MVFKKIYLFELDTGKEIFTNDKKELVDKLNEEYKSNPLFVGYNINKINNIIFKGNKSIAGISKISVLNQYDYYKDLLEDYKCKLSNVEIKHNNMLKKYESSVIEKKVKEYANDLYNKEYVLRKSGLKDVTEIHKLLLER